MNEQVDLKEFLSAYLAEVDENLAGANQKILGVEAAMKEGRSDPRAVRELFRLLHTIKGLSAMVGVEPVVTLAHNLETILRDATQSTGALTIAGVETVFEGLRAIEQRLRELERGQKPAPAKASLSSEPRAAVVAAQPIEDRDPIELDLPPEIDSKLVPFERDLLVQGAREGRRVLCANFEPSPEKAGRGLTINAIRERLGSIADIVKVLPVSVPVSERTPGGLRFAILCLTTVDDFEIASAIGSGPDAVRSLAPHVDRAALSVADEGEGAPFEEPGRGGPEYRNLLRVEVGKVDEAMERLSALIVTRSRLARAIGVLQASGAAVRDLQTILLENTRQLRDLRASILSIRMIPFADVLSRLPLVLRGLRRTAHKEVRLVTEAANAELDKAVAERIFPALVHLVRNAVDHGIESPDERERRGKPVEGLVSVVCSARSNRHLTIEITDDGRGIDRAALSRHYSGEIGKGDSGLLEVLCRPGLSTRTEVTTTSGRGMGMDIVQRTVVTELGGELSLVTEVGVGTTFRLQIPLTVAILDAFTVECAEGRFAVPVGMVEEIIELDRARVVRPPAAAGVRVHGLIERRGETVPLIGLSSLLNDVEGSGMESRLALIVRRGNDPIAFGFDRVLAQQETVVRPLVDPLVQIPGIAGSTDLGDGRPTLVLDLVAMLGPGGRAGRPETARVA